MRRATLSFIGGIVFFLGSLLWMVSERPEFHPGQQQTAAGHTLATLGQGGTALGSAILAYRAVGFVRGHKRAEARLQRDGRDHGGADPVASRGGDADG